MNIQEIAKRLVAYCKKADWEGAQRELYASNAKSTEPYSTPEFEKDTVGLDAILAKGDKFNSMVEKMHSIEIGEPIFAESSFAFVMTMDLTMKGQGRMKMAEICLYQVKDGKIVSEEFFI
ncbi:MAG TPA: SnoaL-like domain-containing protein [Cyclobacteriaceae bacterium]